MKKGQPTKEFIESKIIMCDEADWGCDDEICSITFSVQAKDFNDYEDLDWEYVMEKIEEYIDYDGQGKYYILNEFDDNGEVGFECSTKHYL